MTPSGNRHRADQTATPYPRCGKEHHGVDLRPSSALPVAIRDKNRPAQCRLARLIASERAPTNMRLKAQVASRLNQLRDTNLRPRYR